MVDSIYFYNNITDNIPKINDIYGYEEVWCPITELIVPDIKYGYFISNYGRIYSIVASTTGSGLMKPVSNGKGYLQIQLYLNSGKKVTRKMHRLVAMAFKPFYGCESYLVNHIDGVKNHNWITNLEWCTESYNTIHAINNNLKTVFGNGCNVINTDVLEAMFNDYDNGFLMAELSNKYGINKNSISLMINGHNRKYLKEQYGLLSNKEIDSSFGELDYDISNCIYDMVYSDYDIEDIVDHISNEYQNYSKAFIINIKRKYRLYKFKKGSSTSQLT